MSRRVRTVEKDPRGGWIARNRFTGEVYPAKDFRWNTRSGAWHAAWEARVFHKQSSGTTGAGE